MKTLQNLGYMLLLSGSLFLASCAGGYYVAEQPNEPVYDRPAAPYADAVWIDGDWTWNNGTYVYSRGHWDHGRAGHSYTRGNWEHTNRGYRWHRGHWQ